jgi:hypothetical protein
VSVAGVLFLVVLVIFPTIGNNTLQQTDVSCGLYSDVASAASASTERSQLEGCGARGCPDTIWTIPRRSPTRTGTLRKPTMLRAADSLTGVEAAGDEMLARVWVRKLPSAVSGKCLMINTSKESSHP